MAYVAYLYMEKAYRQVNEPVPTPIPIDNLTKECGIQVSIEDLNEFEEIDWEDTTDNISTIAGESVNEYDGEGSSRSSTPTPEDADDDTKSIISTTSGKAQQRATIETFGSQILPTSETLQKVNTNNQHLLDHPHQSNVQPKINQGSSGHEKQPLLASIPVDSEDEDYRPALPPKNHKKTVSKLNHNRFHSDEV